MEITLPGAVVHFFLFFSILFLCCVVDLGRIKCCALEGHPQSFKKRKAPPEHIEESEVETEDEETEDEETDDEETEEVGEEDEDLISDISKEEDQESQENLISIPIDISEELDFDSIKKEIESTCNFATASEGLAALKNNPSEITERLQTGFDLWEKKTGKKGMTYSEMREMFG